MLVWAKNQARATLSTHETTRRIAELATDVVTGAVEYVPYADGPARFFKEQAHDVLQAPYASLQQSRSESENLVTRLREQLSSCEEELFEARREIKSLKSTPSVRWADESSTGVLTPSTPISAVASEQDLGAIRLRSGERALHETLKTRDDDIRNRIAGLETQAHDRTIELQQQELKLQQLNEEIEQRRKREKDELADAEALRVRLASAEDQVKVLEDLLARALAANDSRKATPHPPGFDHGLQTPPATATDNDLTNSLIYAEPVAPPAGPAQSSRDLPVDEPAPPQLGTSLDYLPGTVDVHGQHFTTFSAVDDLEHVAPSPRWMPGHWGGESTTDLTAPDALVAHGENILVGVEPRDDVVHGFEGPIEHDLGVGIQLHHSLELPRDESEELKGIEEAKATEEATEEVKTTDEVKISEEVAEEVHTPEEVKASEEVKMEEAAAPAQLTVTTGTGIAEDEQDEARRLRPQSIRSVHSVLGTDIAESPERFSFHRSATDAAADADEEVEEEDKEVEDKEDAVIPSPIVKPVQDDVLPAVERPYQDSADSATDTLEAIARTGTSTRSDSPLPTPVADVSPPIDSPAIDSPVAKEAGPTQPTQIMPPSPGYFVAPQHLFNDEPKIFPPSPTSSTSEDPTTRPRAVSVTSAGIQPAIVEAEAEAGAEVDAKADAEVGAKADTEVDAKADAKADAKVEAETEAPSTDAKPTTVEVVPEIVAHPPGSADVPAVIQHIPSSSMSTDSTSDHHDRSPSPSRSQTRGTSPLQRTPQKKRASTTFELLRAIHGTPAAHEMLGASPPLSAGEKKDKETPKEHTGSEEATGRVSPRKSSATHSPRQETEHLEGEDEEHSPRGRALSKAGRPKTKGRISDMVEPVLHVLGLDDKDKERSRERSQTRPVDATHERTRSESSVGLLGVGHKERPRSRVLSVFGVGSGSRRVSSSDVADLSTALEDVHSGDVSLEISASGSDAKMRNGSRRSLVSRFSSLRDSKSRKDRD